MRFSLFELSVWALARLFSDPSWGAGSPDGQSWIGRRVPRFSKTPSAGGLELLKAWAPPPGATGTNTKGRISNRTLRHFKC